MAILITTKGEEIEVSPTMSSGFTSKELQSFVDGSIRAIRISDDQLMIVNEDGKNMCLPLNDIATNIAVRNYIFDTIVGDVLICQNAEIQ